MIRAARTQGAGTGPDWQGHASWLRGKSGQAPIVPAGNVVGHALMIVIAIMTFLACLTIGAVSLVQSTAATWQSQISTEATIQIRPVEGQDMEALLNQASTIAQGFSGVKSTRIIDRAATAAPAGALAWHRSRHR